MANHIFISYSRKDIDFAEDLKEKLEAADVKVWTDKSRLVPGEDWRESIDQAIRDSFALITVVTPTAKASEYVTYEWAFAWGIEMKVIPILLEHTPLHPRLETVQHFDFTHRTPHQWNELTELISELSKTAKTISKNVSPVIQSAITMLDSANKGDQEDAINTLVELNHPVAFRTLIWNLNHHALERVRQAIAQALKQIGDAAVPALIETLDDQRPDVRQEAIKLLEWIGDGAVPVLIEALDDQRPDVREAAAETLRRIGDTLIEALGDQRPGVPRAAAEMLGRIRDAAAVPALIEALGDQRPGVSQAAAEALEGIGDAAVPALIEALGDQRPGVPSWAAAKALEGIRDAAVPALIEALGDQRPGVSRAAAKMLERIGDAAVPALTKARDDQRPAVDKTAAEVLERIEDPRRFVPRLWRAIRSVTRRT